MKRSKTDSTEAIGKMRKGVGRMNIRISEAAKQLGIHPNTLRVLEKRGLIAARRDWAGYRVYSEKELKEIEQRLFSDGMGKSGDR